VVGYWREPLGSSDPGMTALHVLSAELLRARLTGRTGTLGSNEAGALASAMVIHSLEYLWWDIGGNHWALQTQE
jgi:hypothetical protein